MVPLLSSADQNILSVAVHSMGKCNLLKIRDGNTQLQFWSGCELQVPAKWRLTNHAYHAKVMSSE